MTVGEFGHCCKSCQMYWTCETKWFRGEREEENACCSRCNYYNECSKKPKNNKKRFKLF